MDPVAPTIEPPGELPAFARGSDTVTGAWQLALEAYRSNANGNAAADIEHPAITARLLHDAGCDETTVATAVLHDVIEDTGLDAGVIAERCSPEIARRVEALTEDSQLAAYTDRKRELRARGIAAGPEVAVVMAADKLARAIRAAGGMLRPEKLRHFQATLAELQEAYPGLPLLEQLEVAVERLRPTGTEAASAVSDPSLYLNRELSWLDFNERVLQLAEDPSRPLLERVKFCAIYSSNLDEFFMVRVAGVHDQVDAGVDASSADGLPPAELLDQIGGRARELGARLTSCWQDELLPALAEQGIAVVEPAALDDEEREALDGRFQREVFPALTPLAVGPAQPFPYISNLSLSLGVLVRDPATDQTRFARVKVPKEGLPRFIAVADGRTLVPMEAVIADHLDRLFRGMEIVAHTVFRVTRDADFTVSDEADDLLEAVEAQLRRRRFGEVVRLELTAGTHPALRERLMTDLEVGERDVYEVEGLLDPADLWQIVKLPGLRELRDPPWAPITPPEFEQDGKRTDLFALMRERDLLVHHPYDTFATVEQFVGQAVNDPDVLAIKQTVYRTSDDSPLVPALIRAAERGKQAVCLVELTARFDERANIAWARALERAGVHVTFGMSGLKTHAKAVLVVRREGDGVRHYAHVGTGNYHRGTADLYTDFGLFTADELLTGEIAELFNQLTGYSRPEHYRRVLVAPLNLRERIIGEIDATIDAHEAGKDARITMKMNSLVDAACIRALYRASRAGVPIELNVRGACCLRPGVSGVSDTIRVVSIVGRFLEHSRIYAFQRGEQTAVFIGSADLMPRNLDSRVELVVPVDDDAARAELLDTLERCFADTENAWDLAADGTWTHRRVPPGEQPRDVHVELMRAHLARAQLAEACSRRAVIDLGSNSFRLVVFTIGEGGWWKRTDELSDMVRIGGDLAPDGGLSPQRMAHALETLRVFAAFCSTSGIAVEDIEAVATSAIRDAPNGPDFVARAQEVTGLPIRVLSGEAEATYSYVAAVNSTSLSDGVVLDLGGGSLELVEVHNRQPGAIASWALGAVRATERYLPGDGPAKESAIAKLRARTLRALDEAPWIAAGAGRARLIGLGGSVRNLAAAAVRTAELPLDSVQGFVLTGEALDALIADLARRPAGERDRVPGIKQGRGEVILAAAVVLRTVLEATGAEGIEVTEAGLREGIFLSGLLAPAEPPLVPCVRLTSVRNLARQHGVDLVHAQHIADLAHQLLEALPGAGLPEPGEPGLVEAAAVLHDVGMAVDYDDHHKHSSYLILGSGLPGFTPREVALIALMARYHRKGTPQLGALAPLCQPGDEELLLRGAALLRIAEQLERNRDQVVRAARLRRRGDGSGGVELELDAVGDDTVARWGAERQGDLFERAFGAPLTVVAR